MSSASARPSAPAAVAPLPVATDALPLLTTTKTTTVPDRNAPSKDVPDKVDHHRKPDAPAKADGADPDNPSAMPTLPDAVPNGRMATTTHPDGHGGDDGERRDDGRDDRRGGLPAATAPANGTSADLRHELKPDPETVPAPGDAAPAAPATISPVPAPAVPAPASGMAAAIEAPVASAPAASPAPATPNALTPGDESAVVETMRRDDGGARISLSLHPAEMGPVKVDLDRDADGRMNVVVTAHNAETLRGLMADQAHLHAALDAGAGVSIDRQVSFRLEPEGSSLPGGGSFADGRGASGSGGEGGHGGSGTPSGAGGSDLADPGGSGTRTGSAPPVPTTGRMLRSALVNVIA